MTYRPLPDFLGIKPSATQDEVNRAYRARSRVLHPDKAKHSILSARHPRPTARPPSEDPSSPPPAPLRKKPSARELRAATKEASEHFTRLGLITNILRGAERERYDHFLAHGFPRWRGTGYYYARFRPGLGSTLLGLFVFAGGAAHYVALVLGWRARRRFAERLVEHARREAWGGNGASGDVGVGGGVSALEGLLGSAAGEEEKAPQMNRRERRLQAREGDKKDRGSGRRNRSRSAGQAPRKDVPASAPGEPEPEGAIKRVVSTNGKPLVVDSKNRVFLEELYSDGAEDGDDEGEAEMRLYLLNPAAIEQPTIKDTVLWRLPAWAVGSVTARAQVVSKAPDAVDKQDDSGPEAGTYVVVEKEDGLAGGEGEAVVATGRQDGGKQRKRKSKR